MFLQLSPEDDCEHGETDGSSQSHVRIEQYGENEGAYPDQLKNEIVMSKRRIMQYDEA